MSELEDKIVKAAGTIDQVLPLIAELKSLVEERFSELQRQIDLNNREQLQSINFLTDLLNKD